MLEVGYWTLSCARSTFGLHLSSLSRPLVFPLEVECSTVLVPSSLRFLELSRPLSQRFHEFLDVFAGIIIGQVAPLLLGLTANLLPLTGDLFLGSCLGHCYVLPANWISIPAA